MRIRYEDGSEQTVKIEIQARIWQAILDEEMPPVKLRRRDFIGDELATAPIRDLVGEVLRAQFTAPYQEDITDQVCLAIESNEAWLNRYEELAKEFSRKEHDGWWIVNNFIGQWTKDLTGMVNIKEGVPAKSSLIKSYSRLGYP
jgi:hypothetical protein